MAILSDPSIALPYDFEYPKTLPEHCLLRGLPNGVPSEISIALLGIVHAADSAISSFNSLINNSYYYFPCMRDLPLANQKRIFTDTWSLIVFADMFWKLINSEKFTLCEPNDNEAEVFINVSTIRNKFLHFHDNLYNKSRSNDFLKAPYGSICFGFYMTSHPNWPHPWPMYGQSYALFGQVRKDRIPLRLQFPESTKRDILHVVLDLFGKECCLLSICDIISKTVFQLENKIREDYFGAPVRHDIPYAVPFVGMTMTRNFES